MGHFESDVTLMLDETLIKAFFSQHLRTYSFWNNFEPTVLQTNDEFLKIW